MERSERFYKIEMLIRSRGSVSFADLMAETEVSRATLKRDLVHLRSRMDAPIVYDRESNGYRLLDKGRRSKAAETSVAGQWFGDREVHAMLTMLALIRNLESRSTLGRHLLTLQERLEGMLGTSPAQARELLRRVRISEPEMPGGAGQCFEQIGRALTERRRLMLQMGDAAAPEEREVSPQRMVSSLDGWQLDVWCHRDNELQRLPLAAMLGASVLEARARDVALKTVQAVLDDAVDPHHVDLDATTA